MASGFMPNRRWFQQALFFHAFFLLSQQNSLLSGKPFPVIFCREFVPKLLNCLPNMEPFSARKPSGRRNSLYFPC